MRGAAGAAAAALAAAACGAEGDHSDPDVDGGAGGEGCEMVILPTEPAEPETADIVIARGDLRVYGDLSGIYRYDWAVTFEGDAVDITPRDDESIQFNPVDAGVYELELTGSVGGHECRVDATTVNVREIGAETARYRLRVVPTGGGTPSELEIGVPGGADYDLGPIVIDAGASVAGRITGPDGPISGYVRIRAANGAEVEAFADEDGEVRAPRPPGGPPYELVVVPDDPAVAPIAVAGLSESDLAEVALDAGIEIGGAVTGPQGDPVAGASVSMSVGGVPSTVGETDSEGRFTLRARPGEGIVRVSAPEGSGRYDLRAAGVEVDAGAKLSIRYGEAAEPVLVAPRVTEPDGETPAPGARVTWIAADVGAAGAVETTSGIREATGSARRSATADADGSIAEHVLPRASYQLIVAPGAGAGSEHAARVRAVDLADGAPDTLTIAPPATITGALRGGDDVVAGAKVVADPPASLAGGVGVHASAIAGDDGEFSLALAGDVDYELAVIPPAGARRGRAWIAASAPPPGVASDLGDLDLPEAISVRGEVSALGVGAIAGAHVSLRCVDCPADRAAGFVAETATDAAGRFRLVIADPGVDGGS